MHALAWPFRAFAAGFEAVPPDVDRHAVRVWDLALGQEIARFAGHETRVGALAFAPAGRRLAGGLDDGTVLLWEVASATKGPAGRGEPLAPGALQRHLSDLGSPRPADAYRAMAGLAATPGQALALLARHVRPVPPVDRTRLGQLIQGLDSDDFARRQAAVKALTALREHVEPSLRRALAGKPGLEVTRRLEAILAAPRPPQTADQLRARRAVRVLEWIGGNEARKLLQELARGEPEAELTRLAALALARLRHRKSP
jgi:hypothetical protein